MNPIAFCLASPVTVMVAGRPHRWRRTSLQRMKVDIFRASTSRSSTSPSRTAADPAQMEGLLANYYEYHFLYIGGIHHVESKNVQGVSLMKLFFHPAPTWPRPWPRRSATSTAPAPSCRPARCRRSSCASTPAPSRSAIWCSAATRSRSAKFRTRRVPRAADFRLHPRRVGPAAVRGQPADGRRSGRSDRLRGLQCLAG